MKRIWYQINPQLLEDLRNELKDRYPSLHVFIENGTVIVRGNFPICDIGGTKLIDEFKIEMMVPNTFPEDIPIVREIGGRLPKIVDRHFYMNGKACLFMPEERYKYVPAGMTLMEFIDGPMKSFFIGQISYEQTGKWIFGERAHGVAGIVDYYGEIIGNTNKEIITRLLIYLCKDKVKGHWQCFCKSGEKMRSCHYKQLLEMRERIKPKDAILSLRIMVDDVLKK